MAENRFHNAESSGKFCLHSIPFFENMFHILKNNIQVIEF